jgi:hypothetical protein
MDLQAFQKKIPLVQDPKEALDLILRGITVLCSEDGIEMLSKIVEQVLARESIKDTDAKEMLTLKFLEQCLTLNFELASITEKELFRKNLFIWDWIFLRRLISTGMHGKKVAKQVVDVLEENLIAYRQRTGSKRLLRCWFFEDNSSNVFLSPIFLILAEAVWIDIVKTSWMRKKKVHQLCPKVFGWQPSSLFWKRKRI